MITNSVVIEHFRKGDFNAMLSALEKMHPKCIYEVADALFNSGDYDYDDDFYTKLSLEQRRKWKWLQSSERTTKYLMKIPDDQLTDYDLAMLRTCDF